MPITVRVPSPLRALTAGLDEVDAEGATVGAILADLEQRFPGIGARLCDGDGIRRHVNIYANDDDVRFLDGLDTVVAEGDSLTILPAMAGGSGGRRYRRHAMLPEIGAEGQARIEALRLRLCGDPEAASVAHEYLRRAGAGVEDARVEGADTDSEVTVGDALAGRPELEVAAAWLAGAWHAVEVIKSAVGAGHPASLPDDVGLTGPRD